MTGWGKSVWVLIYRGAAVPGSPQPGTAGTAAPPAPVNGEEPRQNWQEAPGRFRLVILFWRGSYGPSDR
jgi:hypothetical protein